MYALPLEASIFIFITTWLSPSPPFPVVLNMTLGTQCRLGLSTTGPSLIGLYLVLKKTFLVGFLGRGGELIVSEVPSDNPFFLVLQSHRIFVCLSAKNFLHIPS